MKNVLDYLIELIENPLIPEDEDRELINKQSAVSSLITKLPRLVEINSSSKKRCETKKPKKLLHLLTTPKNLRSVV